MVNKSDLTRRRYETPTLTSFGNAATLTRQTSGAPPVPLPKPVPPEYD